MYIIRITANYERAISCVFFEGVHTRATPFRFHARRFLTRNEANRVAEFIRHHPDCFIGDATVTVEEYAS